MPTNILSLPLAVMTVETGTNEDWIDSVVFLLDTNDPEGPQLDLRGMDFAMEVRRRPPDHEVIITASTTDGKLTIGEPPDFGYLVINIPLAEMKLKKPDEYVGDIIASGDGHTRRCISFTLALAEGVTR